MGDNERYEGDFFKGEANGTGYYLFESGDFYSGEFLDGKMNGEGCYFTKSVRLMRLADQFWVSQLNFLLIFFKGDASEGIFLAGKFMHKGFFVDPFIPEIEKDEIVRRLIGQGVDNSLKEIRDASIVRRDA